MAETLNYRMNLVIDPKNVIKANRELRAMERYFERIQGRVMRIGRTRMAPEIVLKDRASKGLDGILGKINRVKSQIINASGTVRVEAAAGKDLQDLLSALGNIKIEVAGASEKPKTFWDKLKDGFTATKSIGGGIKSLTDIPGKAKAVGDARKGIKPEDKKDGNAKKDEPADESKPITKTRKQRIQEGRLHRGKRALNTANALGDLISTVGSAGVDLIGGAQGFGKLGKDLFKGGSGIASKAASFVSSAVSEVGNSGVGSIAGKLLKSGSKKLLGPLGFAADAMSIASAKPGKERAQAIGSAAGSTIGSVLGGAVGTLIPIPVVGTAIGSVIGGAVGDFVGGKVGGMVADYAPKIKETFSSVKGWFSKTFSGKKDKPSADISQKPAAMIGPSMPSKPQAFIGPPVPTGPLVPNAAYLAGTYAAPGPRLQSATAPSSVSAGGKAISQLVQISSEQMTAFSGLFKDFKAEVTNQYNLPPGALQVTVHEEHPIDIEGLIQQIGQRLRAEFQKATQNQKPAARAYAL
ncbi:hypothetical protein J23TS9_47820 [Paenibacillus sp. J23TS9]|uniref:hypothetical protein n=1 Tax=Paenibacillus sp. J23TS9 TaxID=2807193 RepID=UPI001B1CD2B8|nr:hypothetical protein [Paenibacillus sp. J23TS9]GIP29652.1 hypothetical protein J23TS9_47820 [Paenibacillus sp. J23TS9]